MRRGSTASAASPGEDAENAGGAPALVPLCYLRDPPKELAIPRARCSAFWGLCPPGEIGAVAVLHAPCIPQQQEPGDGVPESYYCIEAPATTAVRARTLESQLAAAAERKGMDFIFSALSTSPIMASPMASPLMPAAEAMVQLPVMVVAGRPTRGSTSMPRAPEHGVRAAAQNPWPQRRAAPPRKEWF